MNHPFFGLPNFQNPPYNQNQTNNGWWGIGSTSGSPMKFFDYRLPYWPSEVLVPIEAAENEPLVSTEWLTY